MYSLPTTDISLNVKNTKTYSPGWAGVGGTAELSSMSYPDNAELNLPVETIDPSLSPGPQRNIVV